VWEESSGEGEIYTFSLMRKSAAGPYAIGYVTLKEGPSLLTNFVDCDMDKLKIGQKVKVVFKTTDGAPLPFFYAGVNSSPLPSWERVAAEGCRVRGPAYRFCRCPSPNRVCCSRW